MYLFSDTNLNSFPGPRELTTIPGSFGAAIFTDEEHHPIRIRNTNYGCCKDVYETNTTPLPIPRPYAEYGVTA